MPRLSVNSEQIWELIQQLPPDSKQSIFEALQKEISEKSSNSEMDEESRLWLETNLSGELPEYDWGPEGIPEGVPIVCTPDKGPIILGADEVES